MKEFFLENGYFKLKNITKDKCSDAINLINNKKKIFN